MKKYTVTQWLNLTAGFMGLIFVIPWIFRLPYFNVLSFFSSSEFPSYLIPYLVTVLTLCNFYFVYKKLRGAIFLFIATILVLIAIILINIYFCFVGPFMFRYAATFIGYNLKDISFENCMKDIFLYRY